VRHQPLGNGLATNDIADAVFGCMCAPMTHGAEWRQRYGAEWRQRYGAEWRQRYGAKGNGAKGYSRERSALFFELFAWARLTPPSPLAARLLPRVDGACRISDLRDVFHQPNAARMAKAVVSLELLEARYVVTRASSEHGTATLAHTAPHNR